MSTSLFRSRTTHTVVVTSGIYAVEEILKAPAGTTTPPQGISRVTVLTEQTVAAATAELWLLKIGGNPATAGDWFYSGNSLSLAAAGSATWTLASWPGAKIRVKSGGTSGTATLNATAD